MADPTPWWAALAGGNTTPDPSGGLLGAAVPSQARGIFGAMGPAPGSWQSKLGMLAAGLSDAGATLQGRPEDATNALRMHQFQMQQTGRQAIAAMNSPDPATRQQGYMTASMLGIDTAPFRQQQAALAMPALLQAMQPKTEINPVSVTPQVTQATPQGQLPQTADQRLAGMGPVTSQVPGLSIADALPKLNNPDLAAQVAPMLIQRSLNQARRATPQEVAAMGYPPGSNVMIAPDGTVTSDTKSKAAVDQAANAPETQYQKDQLDIARMNATKPISGGYMNPGFLVRDPKSPDGWKVIMPGGAGGNITVDPNSNNLSAQTGLSENAIKAATGQLTGRFAAPYNTELQNWGIRTGQNVDTLLPQAKAAYNILQQNIQRNNQAGILEQELQGSAQNLAPILDAAKRGNVNVANVVKAWAGQQVNDTLAVQIADQLARYRQELAGYNAVAGGHLSQNGTPDPNPDDFRAAERLITNGINSGNVQAIADSVGMSAKKNAKVLQDAIDQANVNYYKLFGANYHLPKQSAPAPASTPAPAAPSKLPQLPGTGTTKTGVKFKILGSQ